MLNEEDKKEILKFIPLDKSWIIRIGILDLVNGYKDIIDFLNQQSDLGGDLKALKSVAESWGGHRPLNVGESGTIYRFVRFYLWKNKIQREIITNGTLTGRSKTMCSNSEIVNWSPEKLLTLDNRTSQWTTMAFLLGDRRKVENPPFKLKVTYDAVEHWEKQRKVDKHWEVRVDNTIYNQALALINLLITRRIIFKPEQAEDYCFARAFDLITVEEGKNKFPSLLGHETNRIEEMEKAIKELDNNGAINSKDHRVIQALVMRQVYLKKSYVVSNRSAVNKTWPQFWDFIDYCKKNYLS